MSYLLPKQNKKNHMISNLVIIMVLSNFVYHLYILINFCLILSINATIDTRI
jgi:hypothetical protein